MHVVHPPDCGGGHRGREVRSKRNEERTGVRRSSKSRRRRVSVAQIMIAGQEHLRVYVRGVHTHKITDVEIVSEGKGIGGAAWNRI